jgi:hypothetical protein
MTTVDLLDRGNIPDFLAMVYQNQLLQLKQSGIDLQE